MITGSNGEEALEMVSNQHPDLVILDVMMPKLDGFTTCERIRQFSNVPIIMLTANGEEQDRVHGLNVGADDYVVKPFSATELVARVRAVLRRAQQPAIDHPKPLLHPRQPENRFCPGRSLERRQTCFPFCHRIPPADPICPSMWVRCLPPKNC